MGKPLSKNNVRNGANAAAYLDTLSSVIDSIAASGEVPLFPAPIGVVVRYQRTADGQGIIMENEAGALFVARFTGPLGGPIQGKRGAATPTFEEAVAFGNAMWGSARRTFYSIPSTGLPVGTLPGGLEWSAPAEGEEQSNPDGKVDLAGANDRGISLGVIVALAAAGWFALRG